jgi:hypothetical protein
MAKSITKKIKVSKKDIECGSRNSGYYCPIALAMKRFGFTVEVTKTTIDFNPFGCGDNEDIKLELPPLAMDFIKRFDAGKKVRPFTFELPLS